MRKRGESKEKRKRKGKGKRMTEGRNVGRKR